MLTNADGNAVILCDRCGIYVEHQHTSIPHDIDNKWIAVWLCLGCDEPTDEYLAEVRQWLAD